MRRPLLLTVLFALALAPGADARLDRFFAEGGDSIALENGRGTAIVVSEEGAVLGTLGRGTLIVVDVRRGPPTDVEVSGCETRRRPNVRTLVCSGRGISFSVVGGAWRAVIRGRGINASAVLSGTVTLQGSAGTYSLRHADERPWPQVARTFRLGD